MVAVAALLGGSSRLDRAEAIRLRGAAIEQLAQLNEDSARALYQASRAADPSYFTAQFEYIMLMTYWFRGPELRRELMAGDTSSAPTACLLAAARSSPDDDRPVKQLLALEARFGPSQCTDAMLIQTSGYSAARAARAMRDNSHLSEVLGAVAGRRDADGDWRRADAMLLSGIRTIDNPLIQLALMQVRAGWRMARGDTAGSLVIWDDIAREVRRDARPGVTAAYYSGLCWHMHPVPRQTPAARDAACQKFFALVRSRRAPHMEWTTARWHGKRLLEDGNLRAAESVLNRVVHLADSLGLPGLQLVSYTLRGRYHVKGGRVDLAVKDLHKAAQAGPAAELPYYVAEAYHNLAHAHEGAGRMVEAAAAADSFAASASTLMPGSSLRWSSRHDAGAIRWSAGWHAAAVRDFEAMVRIIDEHGNDGHAFAGEYFERTGNLGRALQYYRIGARLPNPDARNLAALTRVYEALGLPDSAEVFARLHDANSDRWPINERPLLPDLLVARGRAREAVALSSEWARRQLASGNVEGATIAHLRLAELQLIGRDPRAALTAAMRADSLIRLLQLNVYSVAASTLKGRALFASGRHAEGITALREAARLARARPSTDATLSANLALGDALAALDHRAEALDAFDRAALAVERMTAGLTEDAHRAGFKARHLAPFDGALRALLSSAPATGISDAALRWSTRRKAAALKLAGQPGTARMQMEAVSSLRGRLRPADALIDFSILDSTVVAVVLRSQTAAYTSLAIAPARLTAWIEALRRPLVAAPGGSVDLAHSPFAAAVADSLYRALVMPLEPQLRGATRLAIAPDGNLWYVPFAALVTGRGRDSLGRPRPSYLLERFEVRLLPSPAFLDDGAGGLPRNFRVDALAHDVPGDMNELLAVRTALGASRVRIAHGAAVTERRALAASADILHLAVHGIVDDRDPLGSHLRLAAEGSDDGLLHISEVASRRLVPRLVVLTACEAVSGRLYAGEGLVGVARSFLMSGASHVVASSWPVTASAAELAGRFYRDLDKGLQPAAALRSAQLGLLSAPSTSHPLHWAGFVVFEAPRRQR